MHSHTVTTQENTAIVLRWMLDLNTWRLLDSLYDSTIYIGVVQSILQDLVTVVRP